ncbi:MAG TPA: hypothetical protein VE198_01010, partial [Actinoallomurus sp.]|nr:hypothetical protein [Actinoallomurus sp.]
MSHAEELHPSPRPAGDADLARSEDLDTVLRAARDGDEDAFRTLYRQIHPRLLRYVRTLVADDADDV